MTEYLHDVALSFAGEQRTYVSRVAERLQDWGTRLFFDEDFVVEMWGQDLNEYFQQTYGHQARVRVDVVESGTVGGTRWDRSSLLHPRRSALDTTAKVQV